MANYDLLFFFHQKIKYCIADKFLFSHLDAGLLRLWEPDPHRPESQGADGPVGAEADAVVLGRRKDGAAQGVVVEGGLIKGKLLF